MSGDFDPGRDFPPDGATVRTTEGLATFRDGTMPGWWLPDGRYARPFDSLGHMLAQRWAAASERDVTRTEPGCTCGGVAACQQCQERDAKVAAGEGDRS